LFSSSGNSGHSESEGVEKIITSSSKATKTKITPSEILQRRFKRSFRGYNPDQVEEFLNEIAENYKGLLEENKVLSEEIKRLKKKVEGYDAQRRELEGALISIQKSSQLIEKNAQERAKLIIKEAELTARKVVEESEKKLSKLREETMRLKHQKVLLLTKLKSIIKTHAELLNFYEKDHDEDSLEKVKEKSPSKRRKTPLPHRSLTSTPERGIVLDHE